MSNYNKPGDTYLLGKKCRICGRTLKDSTPGDIGQVCARKERERQDALLLKSQDKEGELNNGI